MKQVVQSLSGGKSPQVIEVPRPTIAATEVLVRTIASVVSPGTEGSASRLAKSGLVAKAKARPDLVRKVVKEARTAGLARTARIVSSRLGGVIPMGYSAAGVAIEVGEAVDGIVPGALVATGGAGKANHAEYQAVPGLLSTVVPSGVSAEDAAFATVGSVALHALRLAGVESGSKVVVLGLGLVGQLTARMALSSGCSVAGIDVAPTNVARAGEKGVAAFVEAGEDTTSSVLAWSRGRGADAVLITASDKSSAPVSRAPELCAQGASVIIVGDVGLHLERRPFYEKELKLQVARSYGPGRYERSYEEWAVDYPAAYVRWTEGRNQEAVLDLLASGRLQVGDLVTHRFDIDEAPVAYELMEERTEPFLGIQFKYPSSDLASAEVPIRVRPPTRGSPGVGLIGAGAFAGEVLVPALKEAGFRRLVSVASASGLSAQQLAHRAGFEKVVSGADAVIDDNDVDVVVVATPHESHARFVVRAMKAGKAVFCEKPVAISLDELHDIEATWRESGQVLWIGFNRRWSPAVDKMATSMSKGSGPLVVTYRVNAGRVPENHWYHDRHSGGRLAGEICHFVDACSAIVGGVPVEVQAVASGVGERALDEDVVVTLRYLDGSLASITYASGGHPSVEKERIDVLGRGHSATLVDFHTLELDGRKIRLGTQDKGHVEAVRAFRAALVDGRAPTGDLLATSRATLVAVARLGHSEGDRDSSHGEADE